MDFSKPVSVQGRVQSIRDLGHLKFFTLQNQQDEWNVVYAVSYTHLDVYKRQVLSLCSLRSRTADEEQYQKVYNVIPNCVEIAGTLRTLNSDVQQYILARMEEIVTGICSTARATGELKVKHVAPVLHNPKANAQELYESACKVLGEDQVVYCNKPSMGSEDAAYFLQEVPGNYFNLVSYCLLYTSWGSTSSWRLQRIWAMGFRTGQLSCR